MAEGCQVCSSAVDLSKRTTRNRALTDLRSRREHVSGSRCAGLRTHQLEGAKSSRRGGTAHEVKIVTVVEAVRCCLK